MDEIQEMQEVINVLQDEETRKAFVKASLKVPKKPKHYGAHSKAPYFKERYGLEAKAILDKMLADRTDMEIKFSDFPSLTKTTLKLRLSQSIAFLLEQLDPEGKYAKLRDSFQIIQERDRLLLTFVDHSMDLSLVASPVSQDSKAWRADLSNFIEHGELNLVHNISDITLSPMEIQEVLGTFGKLEGVKLVVKKNSINIVKLGDSDDS